MIPIQGKNVEKTGLAASLTSGVYAKKALRWGLAVKKSIDMVAEFIDNDYRGDIWVVLFNHSDEDFHVQVGDRIA